MPGIIYIVLISVYGCVMTLEETKIWILDINLQGNIKEEKIILK